MGRLLKSHFVSAVLGGLVVGGALLLSGVAGHKQTETIVDQAPLVAQKTTDPLSGQTPLQIYDHYAPGVVFVRAKLVEQVDSPFNLFHAHESQTSTGTGFLVDRLGDILTNYHVIDGADRSKGISVEFENSVLRNASVVAVDQSNDLAVLRSDLHGVPPIVPLARGDSTSVRVGDPTLTIGNPFGVDRTLTSGIVSALQHRIEAVDGSSINNVIQVDQAPDPGNSGAPLIDANGRVIGINSQMVTGGGSGFSQRVAFAIPIDTADAILSKVNRQETPKVAFLGVAAPTAKTARAGAVVGVVTRDSGAQQAGLQEGDTIVRVDSVAVHSIADVLAIVSTRSPGQVLAVQYRRAHRLHNAQVTLGSRTVPPSSGK
ncbi:MAG TPA: trypsin-like peptidase domain-containing protein [Solirubrobacteraceae bacterium]|jgi:S1-C subfamily serine protease|nr:trypsin-like peptidase domain-containing protein [Solirubrobacteraceae bacterium]